MSSKAIYNLLKITGIAFIIKCLKKLIIPGFNGLSFFDLLKMYFEGLIKGAFSTRATAIAFSAFLAIFPFLLFLLNLIPYVPFDNFHEEFIAFIEVLLPPNTSAFFNDIITDIVKNKRGGLLSSTFILSMFLMTNGINAVFSGFKNSFHAGITRSFLNQYSVAFGVSIIMALFLILTVYVTLYFTYVVTTYNKYIIGDTLYWLKFGRLVFFILMIFLTMATLFYFGTKEGKITHFFSPGAVLTTLLIIITTILFSFYINNFSKYNEIYGSIGALLILMLYTWINSNLVLLGYELNATITKLKKIRT